MNFLSKKSVLITGGGSGIGASFAKKFVSLQCKVWIVGRNKNKLEEVSNLDENINYFICDVTDENQIIDLYDKIGSPDIIIANAGKAESSAFHKTTLNQWQNIMDVNLKGVFLTLREGLLRLKNEKKNWGRLIAISSIVGKRGYPYLSTYAASKHGVIGLVKSVAQEIAKTKITINAICPGYLDTDMTKKSISNISKITGLSDNEALNKLKEFSPQHRLYTPEEVTEMIVFLCQEMSNGINGQSLSICGGETY